MKKILSLALGLAFVFGSSFAIAQDTSQGSSDSSKTTKKHKKSKKNKSNSTDTSSTAPKQ
jgi:hypothetical protein